MSVDFKVRINPMKIYSIDDFFMLRGGMRGGVKDVYFARALGFSQNTADIIKKHEAAHLSDYIRLNELVKFLTPEETAFYLKEYENYKNTGKLNLMTIALHERAAEILAGASKAAEREFKRARPDASESVIKNFLVMMWHRTDVFFGLLKRKNLSYDPGKTLKAAVPNITSLKDYLFLYALTAMGFDVLILNSAADIDEKVCPADLSDSFKEGEYGNFALAEFSYDEQRPKAAPKHSSEVVSKTPAPQPAKAEIKPETAQPKAEALPKPKPDDKKSQSTQKTVRKRKKSFEQLAGLASSIVMLSAVNSKGEIISSGSGIVVGTNGLALSNYHVIEDGEAFAVRTENDDEVYWMTELVKVNALWDLALIRINKDLKPLKLCGEPQKLVHGQEVVAIGSPLGFFNSVSDGIISGFRTSEDTKYVQFTAPISPGSSGGALLNMYGEIIGITSGHIGDSQNINLAVSCENIIAFAGNFVK